MKKIALAVGLSFAVLGYPAQAQVSDATIKSLSTPDTVETRIGTLKFKDGTPSAETSSAVYDNLDFTYAFRAFTDTFQGVSVEAIRQGLEAAGVKDNEFLLFTKLMDSESLFLTANADTIYYIGIIDILTKWTTTKRIEHELKALQTRSPEGVSCVHPTVYASRCDGANWCHGWGATFRLFTQMLPVATSAFLICTIRTFC